GAAAAVARVQHGDAAELELAVLPHDVEPLEGAGEVQRLELEAALLGGAHAGERVPRDARRAVGAAADAVRAPAAVREIVEDGALGRRGGGVGEDPADERLGGLDVGLAGAALHLGADPVEGELGLTPEVARRQRLVLDEAPEEREAAGEEDEPAEGDEELEPERQRGADGAHRQPEAAGGVL